MSGRGKGGKVRLSPAVFGEISVDLLFVIQGLGKGGAKRHRKILRDNIQGRFSAFICPLQPHSKLTLQL
jgi:hypothetical protein